MVGALAVEFGLLTSAELPRGSRIGIFLPLSSTKFCLQQQLKQLEMLFLLVPGLGGSTLL